MHLRILDTYSHTQRKTLNILHQVNCQEFGSQTKKTANQQNYYYYYWIH